MPNKVTNKKNIEIFKQDINSLSYEESISALDTILNNVCLLYTSPSPRDRTRSRMPSSA